MIFVQIAFVVMLVLGFMVLSARAQQGQQPEAKSRQTVTSEKVQTMSREDIQRALKRIESNNPPPQKMGAMCYDMVGPPDNFEYVCPVDGEKTVYSRKSKAFEQATELQGLRGSIEILRPLAKGVSISLDERRLCNKCNPSLSDAERYATLVLQYVDGRTVRTDRATPEDLRYLIGFFSGGLSYKTFTDGQEPLKSVEERLKQLLGEI
ncbi:MAG: hypothetical protein HQL22_12080 [Candidatus Omnitrophica bacterium]|nr:hypothetical protein [Candidatus Omnitrophota bacterium]